MATWTLQSPLLVTLGNSEMKLRPNGEATVTTRSGDACCGSTAVTVFDFRLPGGLVGAAGLDELNASALGLLSQMSDNGDTWAPVAD